MRWNHFFAVLSGLAAVALLAADASAMYHPTLGRFLRRDPIGYADGMSAYEYVLGAPPRFTDPMGLSAASPEVVKWSEPQASGKKSRRGNLQDNVKPRVVPHDGLDPANVDGDPDNDVYGRARRIFEREAEPATDFESPDPGCCFCWFTPGTVKITLTYDIIMSERLNKKGREWVKNYEMCHVKYEYTQEFNSRENRAPVESEVLAHDTRGEAYELTAEDAPACKTVCGKYLRGKLREKLRQMDDAMHERALQRDKDWVVFTKRLDDYLRPDG